MKNDPKIFRDYQNPLRLLVDLRDCQVNPKEVLESQVKLN